MTISWQMEGRGWLGTTGQMFEAAFYSAAIGKAIVSVSGHCMEVNPSFAAMLGYTPRDLAGVHFADFTYLDDIRADFDLFDAVMRGERDSYQLEKRYLHRDGSIVHVLLSATVVRTEDGAPFQFISEIIDLTEQKRVEWALEYANGQLRHQIVTDHLTGLCNRQGFEQALDVPAPDASVSLLVVDLDNFKIVNDTFGHQAGDAVLAEVGRRLSGIIRKRDLAARVGGDEFCILLYGANKAKASALAERIVATLARPFEIAGELVNIGASVGGCSSDRATKILRDLTTSADNALCEVKGSGRVGWQVRSLDV